MANAASIKAGLVRFIPSFSKGSADRKPASPFAKSLREGLLAGAAILVLLVVWMVVRANDTAQKLQSLIPSQSVPIEMVKAPAPAKKQTDPNALAPAPMPGLTENLNGKLLPVARASDAMTPFKAYKKPFTAKPGQPLVSFVVVDYGLSDTVSKSMLDNLPPEVSLVLTAYAADAAKWAAGARAAGHEFWLSLPMQTKDFGNDDSGPNTLLSGVAPEENKIRLFNILGAVTGYAGVVSQKDHAFQSAAAGKDPVMEQIFGRGLAFAESNPDMAAYGLSMAMQYAYPYVQNNIWLDSDLRPEEIDGALQAMELQATQKGKIIAFVHPYPIMIKKIKEWSASAAQKGMQIAPLSAAVQ